MGPRVTFLLDIDALIGLTRRSVMLCRQTFLFKCYSVILCQVVAQLTVHSRFSSGIDLVQYDLAILTE